MKQIKIYVESATFDEACGHRAGLQISVEHVPGEVSEVISRGQFHVGDTLTLWVSALPETAQVVVTPRLSPRVWEEVQEPTLWDYIRDGYEAIVAWWWSIIPDVVEDSDG